MFKSALIIGAVVLPLALGTSRSRAAEFEWDLSTEYGVNTINTKTDGFFAKRVEELSNGRIKITVHPGAALGFREKDHLFAVSDGALQIARTLNGALAGVDPVFLLSSLPFVAKDFDDARKLLKISRPYYDEVFKKHGQKLIHAGWVDPSGLWTKKKISSVEDLKNLRVRTYDAMGTRVFRALGASPLQIAWADVVPQLATGNVDAVLTGVDGGAAAQFWNYADTFTQIGYAMPLSFVHINADVFNALPTSLQEAVMQAGRETAEWRAEYVKANQAAKYKELRAHGMTVVERIDPRLAAALDRVARDIVNDWKTKTGPRAEEILSLFERFDM